MCRGSILGLILVGAGLGQIAPRSDLRTLYETRKWPELYRALGTAPGNDFYRGVVGVVFHQNPERSEALLRNAIRQAPRSEEAYEAYEWLNHLLLYTGQYRRAMQAMQERWARFPNKPGQTQEQEELAGLRNLPDQQTVHVRRSTLKHDDKSLFVPISVNGTDASFFFDTGALVSSTSESEAKRLGMQFTGAAGTTGTMTNRAGFRTAVAKTLNVGGVRLANVSFFVFPDENEPWSLVPLGRRGLLGISVIVAFQTLRWEPSGLLQIGGKPERFDVDRSNLRFDNDSLVVTARIEKRDVLAKLDTGAEGTDLFREFGVRFPELLAQGRKGATEVRGIGGAESYESVTLPSVPIEIGGRQMTLRDAGVLMNRVSHSYVGNFGMDLFGQGRALGFDFSAMRLDLEPAPGR